MFASKLVLACLMLFTAWQVVQLFAFLAYGCVRSLIDVITGSVFCNPIWWFTDVLLLCIALWIWSCLAYLIPNHNDSTAAPREDPQTRARRPTTEWYKHF
ncbi:hypothetical protein SAMN02745129_2030 [Ferrimonas marina]|uniref:Uncharacterized protein n=1 Tax=Ferrimonas marina TaxID=299255 RepID=A0A1M5T7W1_9GAMM|nr:hypothetical protein SAMN02745129_2030 [Ferrimonas marina]